MTVRYDRFLETRRPRWQRLEELLAQIRKGGIERFSAAEVEELGWLYRLTASDLAIARRDFPRDRSTQYVDGLVARAYRAVYRGRPGGATDIWYFVRFGFPAAFRRVGPYTLLCFAIFAVAALVSAVLVTVHSSFADILLPGEAESLRAVMRHHHLWVQSATENHSVAGAFITTNNIQVAIYAFAGGMLLAVPTALVMMYNGISLGAVAALVAQYHLSLPFWSFVAPHGVIELSVIFAAGGAGMSIGDAILRPGLRRRADALGESARTAGEVLLGCAGLLVVAGTIEATFSPSTIAWPLKLIVAAVMCAVLYLWLLGSRPNEVRRPYRFEDVLSIATGGRVALSPDTR